MRNGLKFFTRVNGGGINIASFHSPHSLTWSWILSMRLLKWDQGRFLYVRPYRTNGGLQWVVMLWPFDFQWHRQQPMWFRDMFWRKCKDVERLEHEAGRTIPPPAAPFKPTVIDGQSLH